MKRLEQYSKGDLNAELYQNQIAHNTAYTFKIFKGKPSKDTLVAMSYVYYAKQDKARADMFDRLDETLAIVEDMRNFVL